MFLIFVLCNNNIELYGQSDDLSEIDSLIELIGDRSLIEKNPLQLEKAIRKIGTFNVSVSAQASPLIVRYLDTHLYIQDTLAFLRKQEGYLPAIPFEYLYPAVKTAVKIGEPILPFILFHIVNEERVSDVYKQNAKYVIIKLIGSNRASADYIKKYAILLQEDQKKILFNLAHTISKH